MSVQTATEKARRAGHGEEVEWLGRAGLAAQGIIYALVALLAFQVAVDGRDSAAAPDKEGALEIVSHQPFGKGLLALLAAGFAAYALWRLAQAVVDRNHKGSDVKGLGRRAGYLALAVWYGLLTALTVSKLLGSENESGGATDEKNATAGVFDLPLGRELIFAAAGGFLIAAGWNIYRALSGRLEKKLKTYEMSDAERRTALALGSVGHIARGVVFGVIGVFLAKAALEFDAREARGLDGALLELVQRPLGPLLLAGVAAGLGAFALWCWAQARYRAV